MINIITTLLVGDGRENVYDDEYVDSILYQLWENTEEDFTFQCYTNDRDLREMYYPIPYSNAGYERWWGKIDVFRSTGPCLYFDLDTLILGNIDRLIRAVQRMDPDQFMMLRAFNAHRNWASGIMAWNGDWRDIWKSWNINCIHTYVTDQAFIRNELRKRKAKIIPVNEHVIVRSYKRHLRYSEEKPKQVDVVCFHGDPRIRKAKEECEWVGEIW